jgi:hypothetical protein
VPPSDIAICWMTAFIRIAYVRSTSSGSDEATTAMPCPSRSEPPRLPISLASAAPSIGVLMQCPQPTGDA